MKRQKSQRKRYEKCPEKIALSGIARDESGCVLGYIWTTVYGLPVYPGDWIHKMKPKEMYVEKIGVGAMARGQGIGSALLPGLKSRPELENATR